MLGVFWAGVSLVGGGGAGVEVALGVVESPCGLVTVDDLVDVDVKVDVERGAVVVEVMNEVVITGVEGLELDAEPGGGEEDGTIAIDVSEFFGSLPRAPLSLPEFPLLQAFERASPGELPFGEMTAPHGSLPMTLPGHPHR